VQFLCQPGVLVVAYRFTDNTSEPVTVNLRAGWIYSIIGVCDDDCGDLDLQLHDENGNAVATDFIEDAYPFVTVEPQWDGPFTLSVEMPSCAATALEFLGNNLLKILRNFPRFA
jgi:hypothetical protein